MKKHLPAIVVVGAALVLVLVISFALKRSAEQGDIARDKVAAAAFWARYDADIDACHRGDKLRTVIHEFLSAAEKARRSPPVEPGDLEAAAEYARLDSQIWPLTPCEILIPAPIIPRP